MSVFFFFGPIPFPPSCVSILSLPPLLKKKREGEGGRERLFPLASFPLAVHPGLILPREAPLTGRERERERERQVVKTAGPHLQVPHKEGPAWPLAVDALPNHFRLVALLTGFSSVCESSDRIWKRRDHETGEGESDPREEEPHTRAHT
jgi:hypothetical protein